MQSKYHNMFFFELLFIGVISLIAYSSASFFSFHNYYNSLIERYNDSLVNKYLSVIFFLSLAIIIITSIRMIVTIKMLHTYRKLSLLDPLTNLYNRRYIRLNTQKCISKNKRDNEPFSVILIDLDFFKQINDTYGHSQGDKVLKKISKFLVSNVRSNDIVGRWGGEEFIVLCRNSCLNDSINIAEKLRKGIEKISFNNDISITASFGVSEYKIYINKDKDKDNFINQADKALYKSKQNGRNRVSTLEN